MAARHGGEVDEPGQSEGMGCVSMELVDGSVVCDPGCGHKTCYWVSGVSGGAGTICKGWVEGLWWMERQIPSARLCCIEMPLLIALPSPFLAELSTSADNEGHEQDETGAQPVIQGSGGPPVVTPSGEQASGQRALHARSVCGDGVER